MAARVEVEKALNALSAQVKNIEEPALDPQKVLDLAGDDEVEQLVNKASEAIDKLPPEVDQTSYTQRAEDLVDRIFNAVHNAAQKLRQEHSVEKPEEKRIEPEEVSAPKKVPTAHPAPFEAKQLTLEEHGKGVELPPLKAAPMSHITTTPAVPTGKPASVTQPLPPQEVPEGDEPLPQELL